MFSVSLLKRRVFREDLDEQIDVEYLTVWGRLFQTVAAWNEKDLCPFVFASKEGIWLLVLRLDMAVSTIMEWRCFGVIDMSKGKMANRLEKVFCLCTQDSTHKYAGCDTNLGTNLICLTGHYIFFKKQCCLETPCEKQRARPLQPMTKFPNAIR